MGPAIMESRALSGPEAEGKTAEEVQAMFVGMLGSLPPDEFPNLVRFIPDSDVAQISEDGQFDYGLERLLDGMEADLARAADQRSA